MTRAAASLSCTQCNTHQNFTVRSADDEASPVLRSPFAMPVVAPGILVLCQGQHALVRNRIQLQPAPALVDHEVAEDRCYCVTKAYRPALLQALIASAGCAVVRCGKWLPRPTRERKIVARRTSRPFRGKHPVLDQALNIAKRRRARGIGHGHVLA